MGEGSSPDAHIAATVDDPDVIVDVVLKLTRAEAIALRSCLQGELENDDGMSKFYFAPLRRVMRKLSRQGVTP